MATRQIKFLNVKAGEWGLVLALLLLLAINTMVVQIASVAATAGFIGQVGIQQTPWLWIVDMLITLLTAGLYALVVDRMARVRLISWMLLGFTFFYCIIYVLFARGAPDVVTYPFLYVLADQQYVIFPLAFWALANDVYTMADSKRLFPIIAAGTALGSIAGSGLAAYFGKQGYQPSLLLLLGAGVFLIGLLLLVLTFRKRQVRARQSAQSETNVRETLNVGFDFINNVELFRYLAIAMLLMGLAFTVVEYHFLATVDQDLGSDALKIQTFYGIYSAALIVVTWLFQWVVTGPLLKKVQLKSTFAVLPVVLLVAAAGALAFPGIVGGAGGRFLARLIQKAWDEPGRKSLQNLIPDERRGRVSAFLDSYFYALATIVGCLVVGGLVLAASLGWLAEQVTITIYLVLACVAAVGAVWATIRLRAVYDHSLLNWRLSRSRRKSVLDGIEF